ncbi:MAG: hypothetical protein WKF31_10475 [Thermoleophilaceae bacterium]
MSALVAAGVGHGQEAILEPVGEEVVDDAAVLAAEHRVLGARGRDLRDVVGQRVLEEALGVGPARLDLTHVRDVEDPRASAHGQVLDADALVLHRHLPPREGHETGPGVAMAFVQGRAAQGVDRGRQGARI